MPDNGAYKGSVANKLSARPLNICDRTIKTLRSPVDFEYRSLLV